MFALGQKLLTYLYPKSAKADYEKELDEELSKLEEEDEDERSDRVTVLSKKEEIDTSSMECVRSTGIITNLESNHGLINTTILFDFSVVKLPTSLEVGHKVEYLAYKPDQESVTVVKIEKILNETWDDIIQAEKNEAAGPTEAESSENSMFFQVHKRTIIGVIVNRYENLITIDTDYDKLDVNLDDIVLTYVPQLRDRVFINCKVQTDLSFVDSAGEILKVLSILPARSKKITGSVTIAHDSWGVINNDCFFISDVLQDGYKPSQGDKVYAEIVESERENYSWRCTKVVLSEAGKEVETVQKNNSEFHQKNGISATNNLKFDLKNLKDVATGTITITNNGEKGHKVQRSCFLMKKKDSQLTLLSPKLDDAFSVNPGETKTFQLQANARFLGQSKETFLIMFAGGFKIAREIEINVGDSDSAEGKTGPSYVPKPRRNGFYSEEVWARQGNLVPGVSVIDKPKFVANRIGAYEVPERLRKTVLQLIKKSDMQAHCEELFPCLRHELSFDNYMQRFQMMLHLEEIECFQSMRRYDRERGHFTREQEFLVLEIENLSEKRPSLVIGDTVEASNPWAEGLDANRCYQGVIHKVLNDRIFLKFNPGFQSKYNGEDYRLQFFFSRFSFRKQHYAVRKAINSMGRDFLFPSKIAQAQSLQVGASVDTEGYLLVKDVSKVTNWHNKNLNIVQKRAVKNILRGECRPMPYIIFGPPGTGKTITLIETILQMVTLLPNCRLLIGTPSNSSADLIATRLIESGILLPGDFVRLVSHNLVEKDLISEHLKPYCATCDIAIEGTASDKMIVTDSGLKLKCQVKHLGRHRITISTCVTLGTLLQMAFRREHFTHVLIDEAGQCLEPETLIPIVQIDKFTGQVVLVGDPMQLGPIVLNKFAQEKGLELSFLARILRRLPYMKDKERFPETGYDERLVTKLVYNYRALPSILKVYNDLFYDSELLARVSEQDSREINLLNSLKIMPNMECQKLHHAVYFHGIRGENRQDADSPSWYNAAEAQMIFLFALDLYKNSINAKDVGIITPYQKQVRTIRNLFIAADIMVPKIGTVEEFQGQERQIILISTVRSRKSFIEIDLKHALGFVQCNKRMNVAVSRARSLLVVFGNPHLLSYDPSWLSFIKYCVLNDAYRGCDLPSELQALRTKTLR